MTDAKPYRPNVGAILRRGDGMILMAERIGHPGSWQLPQGGVDPGETQQEALWRELGEELGLRNPQALCTLVGEGPAVRYDFPRSVHAHIGDAYAGQEQTLFLLDFVGCDTDFDLGADPHPEFSNFQWVSAAAAVAMIWEVKRPVLEASFAALGLI